MSLTLAIREYVLNQESPGKKLDALTDIMIQPVDDELYEYCKELYAKLVEEDQMREETRGRPAPKPQRYFVPEIDAEIKVERVTEKRFIAHLPGGLERVDYRDLREWENKGEWLENTK
jgi:hypothetical protein